MKDFYVTLLSNSSMDYFPTNTTSSFTVRLHQNITLGENWHVGLAEIHYSYNFANVRKNHNAIIEKSTDASSVWKIEEGVYSSVVDLVREINTIYGDLPLFYLNHQTKRIKLNREAVKAETNAMILQGNLAPQLGFKPDDDILQYQEAPVPASVLFGVPHQMLIYCDIIQPQFIGHEVAQVLRSVKIGNDSYEYGTPCHSEFKNIHYVPVSRKEFHTIRINIRDPTGDHVPFSHGVLSLKLHFKERATSG